MCTDENSKLNLTSIEATNLWSLEIGRNITFDHVEILSHLTLVLAVGEFSISILLVSYSPGI